LRRALALLAAAAMIAGAVLIRSHLDEKSARQSVATRSSVTGPLTIVCVTELENECNAIKTDHPDVITQVEDAATTAQRLAKGDDHVDGWLTMEPWPDITNELASTAVFATATPIASSPLIITMVKEREVVLAPNCPGGMVAWKCLGDYVGRPWTDVTGGVASWGNITVGNPPLTSATGLLLFGNAVTGYFGRTDIATNDFANDDAFNAWRARMKTTFMETDPFIAFVTQLPAKFAAVGVTTAEEQTNVGAQADKVVVLNPAPQATAVVTMAPVAGGDRGQQVQRLAEGKALGEALKQEGWAVGQIPAETGLPSAGVLLALSGLNG
jgi:hypothetical protein